MNKTDKTGKNWKAETCPLTAEGVDQASEVISEELQKFGLQSREIQRMRLSAEEILLCWLKTEDMKGTFRVEIGRRFRRITLTLRCMGPAVNPLADEGEEFGDQDPGYSILTALGLAPSWQYQDGVNIVTATQKTGKSMNMLLQILIAVIAALIVGGLCSLGGSGTRDFVLDSLVSPVFNAYLGLLSCIIGPMMLLCMIWNVFNIGDARKLGEIGTSLMGRFILVDVIVGIVSLLAGLLIFQIPISSGGEGQSVLQSVVEMVMDIIPSNIIEPFASGNTLQIVFLGILIGVTMLFIKDRVQELGQVISEANTLMMTILSGLSAVIPLFVFLSVIRLILQGTLAENASGLLVVILMCVAVMFLDVAVETLLLMRRGFPLGEIAKDMGPFFLIALTTSSSSAAFSQEKDCLDEKIGVDRKMSGFALPFGNVVFMPAVVVFLILIPLFSAKLYGVELSFATLLLCLLNAVILSIATPPVTGGGISIVMMMLMQLGVPLEACTLAIAAEAILEFPATAANLYDLAVQMICQADNIHLLNREEKE